MNRTIRVVAIALALSLLAQDFPARAEDPKPVPAASAPTGDVGTKEPLIEVSVDSLEITENNNDALGFIWGDGIGENTLHFIEKGFTGGIFDFGKLERASAIQARLDLLIKNSQIRVLANPTLMTKSGYEATFLVGGEIPYPTPAPVGQAPGVEFKKYGVTLKILPTITPRQTIEAVINMSVSNPDSSLGTRIGDVPVPALSTREAASKVEVRDGETVVMAGIKTSRREKTVTRVPVLGYIPILGYLFRHKDETVIQTSLVLFVTFRYVKSAS